MIAPRVVPIVSITGLLGLVLVGWLTYFVVGYIDTETQQDCERIVANREDARSMWLYLVETAPKSNQAKVDAFVTELNTRLPSLECQGGNAVPTPSPSPYRP